MKLLTLVRHAKSSWEDDLPDFERPLNERGERDAPEMGRRLARAEPAVDHWVSSPAKRAARTAEVLTEAVGFPKERIAWDDRIYEATPGVLLEVVRDLPDAAGHAALVGHNPAFTDFANLLGGLSIDNVPTCGAVRLRLPVDAWAEVDPGLAELVGFDHPKKGRD